MKKAFRVNVERVKFWQRLAAIGMVATTISIPWLAQAEEPAAPASKAEVTPSNEPPKLTDELRAVNDLQAAHLLVDYGRRAKSPEALLAAARIFGTVPVQPLKAETKDGEPVANPDPQAEQTKKAEQLIEEARDLTEDLPQAQHDAVQALADALTSQLKVRERGVVGGPRALNGFVGPGQSAVYQFDLVGGFTSIQVATFGFPQNLQVRVVGSLTGLEYGSGSTALTGVASMNFSHLFIAKVTVVVTNPGFGGVPFSLTTN